MLFLNAELFPLRWVLVGRKLPWQHQISQETFTTKRLRKCPKLTFYVRHIYNSLVELSCGSLEISIVNKHNDGPSNFFANTFAFEDYSISQCFIPGAPSVYRGGLLPHHSSGSPCPWREVLLYPRASLPVEFHLTH